jgi:hemerythrin-like domain-containing protein
MEGLTMPIIQDSTGSTACMEHQVFEHIKQALLVTLNWQAPAVSMPRKLSSMQFTIKSFQRHFERVISIESEGGYMANVVEAKPYMQDRIDQLAGDHARFRERLRMLMPQLNDIKEWEEPRFEQVCDDLRALIADIDRHNEQEVELLQESMLIDDGGEG